jgi:hypothetical protein
MKNWLSGIALVLSGAALAVSVWTYRQADERAEAALRRREKALVDEHRPGVERVCREVLD